MWFVVYQTNWIAVRDAMNKLQLLGKVILLDRLIFRLKQSALLNYFDILTELSELLIAFSSHSFCFVVKN